ncbi:MAG: outer membrane protein assembly factor BamD [Pseudomonadota bacterium]
MKRFFYLFAVIFLLIGCGGASQDTSTAEQEGGSAEELYRLAYSQLRDQAYRAAARSFTDVERRYPYSRWAVRAQLMASYAYYMNQDYDEAILLIDRFLRLYPGNEQIAYAYYLRALSFYDQINEVRRDQTAAQHALEALQRVVDRFPQSEYARDAAYKIDLTYDQLAGKDMVIGRWYQNKSEYAAALGRFKRVVDLYETTNHIPEALHRITEVYLQLGLIDQARASAAVLGHNYPASPWYGDSYVLLQDVLATDDLAVPQ